LAEKNFIFFEKTLDRLFQPFCLQGHCKTLAQPLQSFMENPIYTQVAVHEVLTTMQ